MNLRHILIDLKPKDGSHLLPTWETGNKQVRHVILSTLSNEIFYIYCQFKVAKEIWDAMNKKYILKDVSSQIHDYHLLINDLAIEDIKLLKPFVAGYLVKTLPESCKDYKNNMKHKMKQMSL